jgi:hypothetical protein
VLPESWVAAVRVLLESSLLSVSSVVRPRLSPATSAPSTLTSNQLDRARDELVGHHVDQQAGHEADQREDRGQLDQQPTAKLATTQTQGKPDHHPQDDPHQQAGDNHVQNKQAGVVSFVKLPVVGGLCQQEQQDQAHRDHRCSANDDAPAHCAGLVDPPRHPAERRRIHLPESGLSR